jgi:hypothetical protein
MKREHIVRFVNSKVESFGERGDFDSAKELKLRPEKTVIETWNENQNAD